VEVYKNHSITHHSNNNQHNKKCSHLLYYMPLAHDHWFKLYPPIQIPTIQIKIRQFLAKFSHTNILCGQKYFVIRFENHFFLFNIIIFFSSFLYSNLENLIRSVIYILYFNLLSCCGCLSRNVAIRSGEIYTKYKFESIDYAKRNPSGYFINVIIKFILRWCYGNGS
jgi:hypothetical protein